MSADDQLVATLVDSLDGLDDEIPTIVEATSRAIGASSSRRRVKLARSLVHRASGCSASSDTPRAVKATIAALAIDPDALSYAERQGIFADSRILRIASERLVRRFERYPADQLAGLCGALPGRLRTFSALQDLLSECRPRVLKYLLTLYEDRTGVVKGALASAEIEFLRRTIGFEDHPVVALAPRLKVEVWKVSAESWAEVVAQLVHDANATRRLDVSELQHPTFDALHSEITANLLGEAALHFRLRETVWEANILGYQVERRATEGKSTYVVRAPSWAAERALRFAYIVAMQLENERMVRHTQKGPRGQPATMAALAELLMTQIPAFKAERINEPFPRYRLNIPFAPEFWQRVLSAGTVFADEASNLEGEATELLVDGEKLRLLSLPGDLSVEEFRACARGIRLQAELQTAALRRIPADDGEALGNSLVRAMRKEDVVAMVAVAPGVDVAVARKFVDLMSWGRGLGTDPLDLQYTPFVQVGELLLFPPRILGDSMVARNHLSRSQRRVETAGAQFTSAVAEVFRHYFARVSENRSFKINGERAEVDVVVLVGEVLFLIECKHSLVPATVHEHGDIWNDIRHAQRQLTRARELLLGDAGLQNRVATWFGAKKLEIPENLELRPMVITSTRAWCGLQLEGVPVRDIHALASWLQGPKATFNSAADRVVTTRSYERTGCTPAALLEDFVAENGSFLKYRFVGEARKVVTEWGDEGLQILRETIAMEIADLADLERQLADAGLSFVGAKEWERTHPLELPKRQRSRPGRRRRAHHRIRS